MAVAGEAVRLQELSGALGDLGSFIPYTVNLANKGFVDFGAALVMAGLYNTPATKQTMKSSLFARARFCSWP